MPTLGENFGHVFLEALAAGCPLIISDRTPWLRLDQKGIGWDLPLDKSDEWIEKLNLCIELDQLSYSHLSNNARQFAVSVLNDRKYEEDTLRVLDRSLQGKLTN
jgi:glycosyltransferase involved in cell wall biosynthesis